MVTSGLGKSRGFSGSPVVIPGVNGGVGNIGLTVVGGEAVVVNEEVECVVVTVELAAVTVAGVGEERAELGLNNLEEGMEFVVVADVGEEAEAEIVVIIDVGQKVELADVKERVEFVVVAVSGEEVELVVVTDVGEEVEHAEAEIVVVIDVGEEVEHAGAEIVVVMDVGGTVERADVKEGVEFVNFRGSRSVDASRFLFPANRPSFLCRTSSTCRADTPRALAMLSVISLSRCAGTSSLLPSGIVPQTDVGASIRLIRASRSRAVVNTSFLNFAKYHVISSPSSKSVADAVDEVMDTSRTCRGSGVDSS